MRGLKTKGMIFTIVLLAGVLFCSFAFAASLEQPQGEPPFGLKIEGAAGGTKLYGVIALQLYDIDNFTGIAKARAMLRVRKGNTLFSVFADKYTTTVFDALQETCNNGTNFAPIEANINIPSQVQLAVTCAMKNQILNSLFPGESNLNIHLKTVTDFVTAPATFPFTDPSVWDIADVELVVN